ncbi:MAG: hypothetical protein FRX49_02431 [Trebouxia sp. A1-2]|nr:MAG: hypothetical protein FRX49_02431 [Trebouxia sp. A1-2]
MEVGSLGRPSLTQLATVASSTSTFRGSEMPAVMGAPLSVRNLIHSLISWERNLEAGLLAAAAEVKRADGHFAAVCGLTVHAIVQNVGIMSPIEVGQLQGGFRPGLEPVNDSGVDGGQEALTAHAEVGSHRTGCEHHTTSKVAEDERLGIRLLVVVINVRDIEVLFGNDDGVLVVVGQILHGVQLQSASHQARRGHQQTLEDIGQMAHVFLKVPATFSCKAKAACKILLKCNSLGVVDVLLSQFGTVKPVSPAQMLADEGDGHGCLIWIQLGHVQVIHKVDQLLGAWRPIVDASLQQMTQSHQLAACKIFDQEQCRPMAMNQNMRSSLPTPAPPTNMIGFFRPTMRSKKNLSEEVPFHHLSKFFLQQVGLDSITDRNASSDSKVAEGFGDVVVVEEVGVDRLVSASLDGLGQHLETLTSARAGGSHQEDAVTNGQQLRQLYHPQDEVVFWGETHFQGGVHNNL